MRRLSLIGILVALLATTTGGPAIGQPIPPNVSVTGSLPGLQNEEQVWICPSDTTVFVTNHRDFRLGYRQIGLGRGILDGLFWTDTLIHPDYQIFTHQSDPVMTVNSSGDIIINHLDYRGGEAFQYDSSYLAFMVSSDCGATWNGPYTVEDTIGPYFEDKQFITCDRTGGPHDGNIYISWTRFDNPTRIMFARSTKNATSFDDTLIVGPTYTSSCFSWTGAAGQFSQPLVGKDGAVYVFWQGAHVDSLDGNCDWYRAIRMNKSTDGGVTWQGDRVVVSPVDGYGSVDGGVDVYSQPTTEADIFNGPHAGNLYLQYRDEKSTWPWDSDILFQRSLDTGQTWSAPVIVNDDPVGPDVDQFHNWLVINEAGILVSIWYDQRTDPGHFRFDVFAAYSYDGGETWTSNHRISDVSIDPGLLAAAKAEIYALEGTTPPARTKGPQEALSPMAGLIAEYIGLSCIGDKIVAVWTDTRFGDQDVMSATWHLPLTDPRLLTPADGDTVGCDGLDWATAWKETEDSYQLQIDDDPGFASPDIDTMLTDNQFGYVMPVSLPAGMWHWRIRAFDDQSNSTAFSPSREFYFTGCCNCPNQGDAAPLLAGDGVVDVLDVVACIDYVFRSGPEPAQDPECPNNRVDVAPQTPNCGDGSVDVLDVVKLIDHVFRSAPPPCNPCV